MTSQRSVCQRSGPAERARARDETTLPASPGFKRLIGQPCLVTHLAHDFAASVLIHRGAEMATETPEDLADVVVGIAVDRQSAQAHRAQSVLQLIADLGQQRRGRGKWEVLAAEAEQWQARALQPGQRGIDLRAVAVARARVSRRRTDPAPCHTSRRGRRVAALRSSPPSKSPSRALLCRWTGVSITAPFPARLNHSEDGRVAEVSSCCPRSPTTPQSSRPPCETSPRNQIALWHLKVKMDPLVPAACPRTSPTRRRDSHRQPDV